MWLFLPDAFFSIVQHRDKPGFLLVRARLRGDIERYFTHADVQELPGADYRFRAALPRELVYHMAVNKVDAINYPDFKSQIAKHDHLRKGAYFEVWSAMRRAQEDARLKAPSKVLLNRSEVLALIDAVLMQDHDDAVDRAADLRELINAGGV